MRKNVWKRFLAAALAAVVMFTSVDCTGLVVNAEGTTKTLGEMVSESNSDILSTREINLLKHPDLMYNDIAYDFATPEDELKSKVELDITTQTISVNNYEDEAKGITWVPISVEVNFKDASVANEEAVWDEANSVYRYTTDVQTAEVNSVSVVFRPLVHVNKADQAEILNAAFYLYNGSLTAQDLCDALGTDAAVIESSVDYLSQAVTIYTTLIADESTLGMLQFAGIELPEIDTDALSANVNALKALNGGKGFELGTIAGTGLDTEDGVLFWKEYAQDILNNITESESAIAYLAQPEGDLVKLGNFLKEVGEKLQNEDASRLGNKITGDYLNVYNSYLGDVEEIYNDELLEELYVEKTALVTGNSGGIELPRRSEVTEYEEADIRSEHIFAEDVFGRVEVTATATVVEVSVSAKVIENNVDKVLGPKSFNVTIEKGKTVADVKAKAAGLIAEKLAEMDAEDKYNLNDYSDVYAPTYYECKVEPENLTITDRTSISITYSPKNYVVTYKEDGKDDVTETVPYLYEITLPGSEVENQSYEYTLVSAPEMDDKVRDEGAAYLIKGNVTFKRTLGKSKDVYRVNDIVLDAYTELKGTDAEDILKHSAVKSDTVAVRKPDNSLISATVEGKTTIVTLPNFEANSEFTWVPNRIFVKNKGITVATIEADQIIDGVARIAYPKRDSIEVEYALEIASGEKADEYVNLAYDLVQSVNEHISDMEKLVEYQADLASLNGGIFDMLSKANAIAEYTEVKNALADIANYGCYPSGSGSLIISNYVADYLTLGSDMARVQFYFDNYYCETAGKEYTGLRSQIELLADNLEIITKEENKPAMDALIAMLPQFADKVSMLDEYAARIGELRDDRFEPMHGSIIAESSNYDSLMETILSSSVSKISNVTSLCMTEKLTISGDDLPAAAKEQTVNVKVEWTKNGEVLSKEVPVVFYDVDSTEEVVALMDEKAAALATELAVDTLHYECTEPTINANPANGSTVTYKWDAKTYTVTFVDEQGAQIGAAQTFTYELPKFDLERPDTDHVYTYVIGTEEVTVISETDVVTYALSNAEFKAMFDDANTTSVQITRKISEVEWDDAWITVNVVIEGSNGVTSQAGSSSVKFKVNGLGAEGVENVKATAATIASAHVDTAHYTCTEPTSAELNENITENTTVTYTWRPNEYGVELWGEGDADYYSLQKFYYDNPVISLDRPSKGYVHTFDINGPVTVKFAEGTYSEEYRFSEETFKTLFDDKGLETIKINKVVSEQVINVTVQVKWQGNVAEQTFAHGDYTEAGILDLVAQMADNLEVDKVHYVYEKPEFVSNPEDDVTYVFEYKAKEYTVNLADETNPTYKTQKITYDDPTFYLVYPTSEELVYTYTVLGNEYKLEYTGEEVFEFYLGEELFDTFFAGNDSVTIERTETEKEAQINVVVKVLDGQGNEFDAREVRVYIPVSKLGAEGIETVKATAADLAGRYFKLNYLTAVDPEFGEKLTDGEVVTFVWNPTKYTVTIVGETDAELAEQVITYYSKSIKFSRPASDAVKYYYNIGTERIEVLSGGEGPMVYNIPNVTFEALIETGAEIVREEVYVDVEESQKAVSKLETDLNTIYGAANVKDTVDLLHFNQSKQDVDAGLIKGNPEAMVIRINDNESEDGGITTAIAATVGGLAINNAYVEFIPLDEAGNPVVDKNGEPVRRIVKDQNGISLQAAIDAFLYTGIGTESIAGMFDANGNPMETVELPEGAVPAGEETRPALFRLFARRTSEKLGAEVLNLDVRFGDNAADATTLQFIFSFIDDQVTGTNKEFRASFKALREIAEITGKDGHLTVDVKEPYSKEVFETYLMMMLLEGEAELQDIDNNIPDINSIKLADVVDYEYSRFIRDLQGKGINIQTLENTMAKVGIDYDLNANSMIEKAVNKLLDAAENDGYENNLTAAMKFYMDRTANATAGDEEVFFKTEAKTTSVLGAATAMGIQPGMLDMITNLVIAEEMNGHLNVPLKLTAGGINSDDAANDYKYAAAIINDPRALANISGANASSMEIAANAIQLVEASKLTADKVPANSMVVLLTDALENETIKFAGNGIIDLNGHKVEKVVGKDNNSTVVLVDSTYGNRGSAVAGTNVKDARLFGNGVDEALQLYTVSQDAYGNLTVALDGNALAEAAVVGTTELKVLAIEIALDLMMNNITSGDMLITGTNVYDVYDVDIVDDIFELMEDLQNNQTGLINDVIDIVRLGEIDADPKNIETRGLFGFVNDVLAALTKVDENTNALKILAEKAKNGSAIASYKVETNPVKLNFAVAGNGDGYITAGIKTENVRARAAASKTVKIDFVVAQNGNEQKLIDLFEEMGKVVEKSDINVDLDSIKLVNKDIEAIGASVNATLHAELLRGTAKTDVRGESEAKGNHDYAAIIALIAAYGNNGVLSDKLVDGVEAYLKDGSIDELKKAVDDITVKQLISAVKNANGKTFAQIIAGVNGVTDSVKELEAVYEDLFRVVYRLVTIVSSKLGIEGDNSKLGSLLKTEKVKVGDVTFTYYSYGGDYESSRQINQGFFGINAKAEGSVYADLRLTLFVEDDAQDNGGNQGGVTPTPPPTGGGTTDEPDGPVEVHPAPSKPSAPSVSTGTSTGDVNNMALWISVMGIAVVAVVATMAMKKRKAK